MAARGPQDVHARIRLMHAVVLYWTGSFNALDQSLQRKEPDWSEVQKQFADIHRLHDMVWGRRVLLRHFNGFHASALDVMGVPSPGWHDGVVTAFHLFSQSMNLWLCPDAPTKSHQFVSPWQLDWLRKDLGRTQGFKGRPKEALRAAAWNLIRALALDEVWSWEPLCALDLVDEVYGWARLRGKDYFGLEAHLDSEYWCALRHAEVMAGREMASQRPEPQLTRFQDSTLRAMHQLGALSQATRQTRTAILKKMGYQKDGEDRARQFARLKTLGYTLSISGPEGGVWLTDKGAAMALASRLR